MANRFLDRTITTGNLTGTWDWTNGSNSVTAVAASGDAINDGLQAGDYVRSTAKNEWYKVSAVPDKDTITLAQNYQEANEGGATVCWSDVSVQDGTTIAKAFVHINEFTTDEARAAGDVLYVRRGQTHHHEAVDITFDENGTSAAHIKIIADDGTYWSGEGGLADPIFDFNGASINFSQTQDNYWWFEELHWYDSHDVFGALVLQQNNRGTVIKNCTVEDTTNTFGGIFLYNAPNFTIIGTAFINNDDIGIRTYPACNGLIKDCTIDGSSSAGLYVGSLGLIMVEDCDFSQAAVNNIDIRIQYIGSGLQCRNCRMGGTTEVAFDGTLDIGNRNTFMDYDSVQRANRVYAWHGNITRDTVTVRAGGDDTSVKIIPIAAIDDDYLNATEEYNWFWETWIYNPGAQATYTVYMTAGGVWTVLPVAAELYLEVAYFDGADGDRATVVSNDVIAVEGNWAPFDVTCTPNNAGPIRLRAYLTKYEANKEIYLDPLVVVT